MRNHHDICETFQDKARWLGLAGEEGDGYLEAARLLLHEAADQIQGSLPSLREAEARVRAAERRLTRFAAEAQQARECAIPRRRPWLFHTWWVACLAACGGGLWMEIPASLVTVVALGACLGALQAGGAFRCARGLFYVLRESLQTSLVERREAKLHSLKAAHADRKDLLDQHFAYIAASSHYEQRLARRAAQRGRIEQEKRDEHAN